MLSNLNSILLEGILIGNPVLSTTQNGSTVCVFRIKTSEYSTSGDEDASFFEIEVWRALAKSCQKHLFEGRGVRVVGKLKEDRWLNAEGEQFSKIKVVGEHVEFKPVFASETKLSDTGQ